VATLCASLDYAVAAAHERIRCAIWCCIELSRLGARSRPSPRPRPRWSRGEVVALVLPNSIEFPIEYFAALKALAAPASAQNPR